MIVDNLNSLGMMKKRYFFLTIFYSLFRFNKLEQFHSSSSSNSENLFFEFKFKFLALVHTVFKDNAGN